MRRQRAPAQWTRGACGSRALGPRRKWQRRVSSQGVARRRGGGAAAIPPLIGPSPRLTPGRLALHAATSLPLPSPLNPPPTPPPSDAARAPVPQLHQRYLANLVDAHRAGPGPLWPPQQQRSRRTRRTCRHKQRRRGARRRWPAAALGAGRTVLYVKVQPVLQHNLGRQLQRPCAGAARIACAAGVVVCGWGRGGDGGGTREQAGWHLQKRAYSRLWERRAASSAGGARTHTAAPCGARSGEQHSPKRRHGRRPGMGQRPWRRQARHRRRHGA